MERRVRRNEKLPVWGWIELFGLVSQGKAKIRLKTSTSPNLLVVVGAVWKRRGENRVRERDTLKGVHKVFYALRQHTGGIGEEEEEEGERKGRTFHRNIKSTQRKIIKMSIFFLFFSFGEHYDPSKQGGKKTVPTCALMTYFFWTFIFIFFKRINAFFFPSQNSLDTCVLCVLLHMCHIIWEKTSQKLSALFFCLFFFFVCLYKRDCDDVCLFFRDNLLSCVMPMTSVSWIQREGSSASLKEKRSGRGGGSSFG